MADTSYMDMSTSLCLYRDDDLDISELIKRGVRLTSSSVARSSASGCSMELSSSWHSADTCTRWQVGRSCLLAAAAILLIR